LSSRRTILLVEDEERIRFSIRRFFANQGYEVREADSVAQADASFRAERPDAVILDNNLPDGDGVDLIAPLRALDASMPILVLTAHGSIEMAVRAVKEGADQFLTKPVELPALLVVVERLLENQRNRQARLVGRTRSARQAVDPFLGQSPVIRRLAEQARRVLASASPVLLHGETGTGKGVLAQWLHQNGPRADEAFVDLNCAGLSREFLETELFGHEKGAFTGAHAAKPGLLDMAHRGTLFLDEVGDMDLAVQAKLLKVLEEQRFRRLGDVRDRQVDLRLIAASHLDLKHLVAEGRFRGDLFYRISTLPLQVPALRERGEDLLALARVLLSGIGAEVGRTGLDLEPDACRLLEGYSWPGNIRELRNVLERAVLLGGATRLGAGHLREAGIGLAAAEAAPARLSLEEAERRHIAGVLALEDGNVESAAAVLGLSRSALYKRLKTLQIPTPRRRR
jgi:DNA-binding NtrC family response regulator